MLSRLLEDRGAQATPVVWRTAVTAPDPPPAPVPGHLAEPHPLSEEVLQLQAKLAEARALAEQKAKQAYETGYREGDVAAKKQLQADVNAQVERFAAAAVEVAAARADTIRRAHNDTVKLAIEIARRVLHRELTVDASALEALIKAALEKLQSQEVYRVRVHPEQEGIVRTCLEQTGRGTAIAVVSDPVQPKGGVVFDIARGSLDASVDTQLSEIERGLADHLEIRA